MTDIDSLILQALSCVSNSSLQGEVNKASQKLVTQLISQQNKKTGAVGNHISTSHVLKVRLLGSSFIIDSDHYASVGMR